MLIKGLAEIKVLSRRGDASEACSRFFNRLTQVPPKSTIHFKTKDREIFVRELYSLHGSTMLTDQGPIDLTHVNCVCVYENVPERRDD